MDLFETNGDNISKTVSPHKETVENLKAGDGLSTQSQQKGRSAKEMEEINRMAELTETCVAIFLLVTMSSSLSSDSLSELQTLFATDRFYGASSEGCEYSEDLPILHAEGQRQIVDRLCSEDPNAAKKSWKSVQQVVKSCAALKTSEVRHNESRDQAAMTLAAIDGESTALDHDYAVAYNRILVAGDAIAGVPVEDFVSAAAKIVEVLKIRSKYAEMADQSVHPTTGRFLNPTNSSHVDTDSTKHDSSSSGEDEKPKVGVSPYENIDPSSLPGDSSFHYKMVDGVIRVYKTKDHLNNDQPLDLPYPHLGTFLHDLNRVMTMTVDGPMKTFCFRRLSYLMSKFRLHVLLNETQELAEEKFVPHRDFYNCRKVDTHIHASACMGQRHLLRFMKRTMKDDSPEIVYSEGGKDYTLRQVCEMLKISPQELSIDSLDVHAGRNTFQRFDKFNSKYNPVGQSILRHIYIKTDNLIHGKFFALLVKQVMRELEESKFQNAELRISIYGKSPDEWKKLAKWAIDHNVYSHNVRWLIQVPRIFDIYCKKGILKNFAEMMDNLFRPLFEATLHPEQHPELYTFLKDVSGFDSVDDESKSERRVFTSQTPLPEQWSTPENPPYSYYIYYMYANIVTLNQLRKKRGMNLFNLRPHCGEAGPAHHLVTSYLLAENISHGLLLRKVPVIQYLYYLHQVGIAMSPLSNNSLFLKYLRNPFPEYFARGLNVSLSTDDPLQFHFTNEPLMEEYGIAAQVWNLNTCDMCEIARNSVVMSGFPLKFKRRWLGSNFQEEGVEGNTIRRTNVPDIRVSYRHETLFDELNLLFASVPQLSSVVH